MRRGAERRDVAGTGLGRLVQLLVVVVLRDGLASLRHAQKSPATERPQERASVVALPILRTTSTTEVQ